jgi:hypothetical protein
MMSVENKLLRKVFITRKDTVNGAGRYYRWKIP